MRTSKYDAATLQPIVDRCHSFSEVIRALGLVPNGGNYRMIAGRLRTLGIDTTRLRAASLSARVEALPSEQLVKLTATATSVAGILAALSLPIEGRAHIELTRRLRVLAIDTTHLRGARWSRGETAATHPSVAKGAKRNTWPDDKVFVEASGFQGNLSRRLRRLSWAYKCGWCEISDWRGQPLVLHIDHINGISNDHRLENLRLLCPNCHSQTPTYGNRRRK